jgi:hypothetical protein
MGDEERKERRRKWGEARGNREGMRGSDAGRGLGERKGGL